MPDWRGWTALGIFTIQNGCTALIVRYATNILDVYNTSVGVLMMEVAVKLPLRRARALARPASRARTLTASTAPLAARSSSRSSAAA